MFNDWKMRKRIEDVERANMNSAKINSIHTVCYRSVMKWMKTNVVFACLVEHVYVRNGDKFNEFQYYVSTDLLFLRCVRCVRLRLRTGFHSVYYRLRKIGNRIHSQAVICITLTRLYDFFLIQTHMFCWEKKRCLTNSLFWLQLVSLQRKIQSVTHFRLVQIF